MPERARNAIDVAIVGDRDASYTLHLQTEEAVQHAASSLRLAADLRWVAPVEVERDRRALGRPAALICAPAPTAYSSFDGALTSLRLAREQAIPTLATCGGCQHAVLEYARNVAGIADAAHAGRDPDAAAPLVAPLACSLVGRTGSVRVELLSRAAEAYGSELVRERYSCSYGIEPAYEERLEARGLRITGRDADDRLARIFELPAHPFYLATLFVPQARSTAADPHPLVLALLRAARDTIAAVGARAGVYASSSERGEPPSDAWLKRNRSLSSQ
jgi:CTP synthase (UTP-ammonia lyase)